MRPVFVGITLLIALGFPSGTASADVICLNGNDLPLSGTIIEDDPEKDHILFRIKGLRDGSEFQISRSRISRYWREENNYVDYAEGEREREETLERLRNGPSAENIVAKPAEPPPRAAPRTYGEVRANLLARAKARVASFLPDHPILRVILAVCAFLIIAGLLQVGSRVADLPRLKFGRASLLALVTLFLVVLGFLGPGRLVGERTLPLLISGEILTWVMLTRILGGGTISRSVLLLSFFISSIFVVGGSLFSIVSAI